MVKIEPPRLKCKQTGVVIPQVSAWTTNGVLRGPHMAFVDNEFGSFLGEELPPVGRGEVVLCNTLKSEDQPHLLHGLLGALIPDGYCDEEELAERILEQHLALSPVQLQVILVAGFVQDQHVIPNGGSRTFAFLTTGLRAKYKAKVFLAEIEMSGKAPAKFCLNALGLQGITQIECTEHDHVLLPVVPDLILAQGFVGA